MVRISMFSIPNPKSKQVTVHQGEFERIPNFHEMMDFCEQAGVMACDFQVQPRNKARTFFVGKVLTEGNHSGTKGKRRATKYYLFCDEKPKYEDWLR